MGFDSVCNTGLVLGLGFSSTVVESNTSSNSSMKKAKAETAVSFEPSLTLGLSGETNYDHRDDHHVVAAADYYYKKVDASNYKGGDQSGGGGDLFRQDSAASSFSNNVSVKREREVGSEEVGTVTERLSSRVISYEDDDGVNGRKKLRLTKAQSALLEESFKLHSTLNPQKQKQELARELKLRPRQVEVWFQNRRARTKLKQTEVDCEYLKKCCETLTDENRRLQKELQELKALKQLPFYMQQLPAATLTMCPSCERIGDNTTSKSAFAMAPKPHFFNPFSNPSAAC